MLRRKVLATLAFALLGVSGAPRIAHADTLSADEETRLAHGQTVTRDETIEIGDARYVGGITYTILDAAPEEMEPLFQDVEAYKRVLPRTRDAKLVGRNGPDTFIELHQGNALVEAAYTIRIRKNEAAQGNAREVRFWLDPTKPHAIRDAWGFFRYEPMSGPGGAPKVLLTYGILVDLGPGIVRELFEERVRVAMLSVPQLVKGYVSSRKLASN